MIHQSKFIGERYKKIEALPTVSELVKDNNRVHFAFYRSGFFYYIVVITNHIYEFPVPIEDIGNATLHDHDKAITFMRWIRKSIEEGTIQEREILMA